jgi:hypothetical protein
MVKPFLKIADGRWWVAEAHKDRQIPALMHSIKTNINS